MNEKLNEELQWVEAARNRDPEAFAVLVRRYEQRVLALTTRMCRNPEDGEEAAQEAFLSAWQALPDFRGNCEFSTWLYRLARNACIDLLRRESVRKTVSWDELEYDVPAQELSPQEVAEQGELRQQIQKGLQTLTPEYREVIILREIHQLTYQEIADTLELDIGTVKSRINRARKQLRKFFQSGGNFSPSYPSKEAKGGSQS